LNQVKRYLNRAIYSSTWLLAIILGCIIIGKSIPVLLESTVKSEVEWRLKNWKNQLEQLVLEQQFPVIIYTTTNQYKENREDFVQSLTRVYLKSIPLFSYLEKGTAKERQITADPAYDQYMAELEFKETYAYVLDQTNDPVDEFELAKEEEDEDIHEEEVENTQEQAVAAGINGTSGGGVEYSLDRLSDFDFLLNNFYSVHSSTTANSSLLNAAALISKDLKLTGNNSAPQILIYHTHGSEEYADYASGNTDATVVGVGSYLTQLLTEQYGYHVIHDTTIYDYVNGQLDRNKAYSYALEGITKILQENPSIEVIIDLHRDGVREDLHFVTTVNGKPTSKIMFFNGISQNIEGEIEYLKNPYREDNLSFSLQMQLKAAASYPDFTRKIYLKGLRYNLHLRARSTLIEVGAQNNTYEEAKNAMEPLADILDQVLRNP